MKIQEYKYLAFLTYHITVLNIFRSKNYPKAVKEISEKAESYDEWLDLAKLYDEETGLDEWRKEKESDYYDNDEIRIRLDKLKRLREAGDDYGLLFTLNEGIHGNMAGMANSKLHTKALSGTKHLIKDYVDEIVESIDHIANLDHSKISLEEKLDFFNRASHCYGRTALMMSGGGQLGHFHMGVLKALIENDLLPNVISGSSAGSIFTALVGTKDLGELKKYFDPEQLMVEIEREEGLMARIVKKRGRVRIAHLQDSLERNIPNLTFQEAYEKTGRFINISVAPYESYQNSRLLNATASPNVLVRSAVMASCAIPGVFPPVLLMAKDNDGKEVPYLPSRRWVDGSMTNDLPAKRLSRLYGVNHFIVSLTNPLILPFVKDAPYQNDLFRAVRTLGTSIIKDTTQFNYSLAKPLFKYFPKLAVAANGINSIVQQYYQGDINITADFSVVNPAHILSSLTYEEISGLIRNGEKATWPKIERIKISTKIARLLDDIRVRYSKEELELANAAMNAFRMGKKSKKAQLN